MVTKVIEAAPPTRKYEIMSGSTKAAFSASASTPRPKSQTMYLTRTSPMIRERKVDAISRMGAVTAVCACDGRSNPRPRAHRDCGAGEDCVGAELSTGLDFTGLACGRGPALPSILSP